MKKSSHKILALASLLVAPLAFAGTLVHSANFERAKIGWTGRPGSDSVPPNAEITTNGAVPCLTVKTQGKLGEGFQWTCPERVTPGIPYRISFRLKLSATEPVTYQVTTVDGTMSATDSENWNQIAYYPNDLGKWVDVSFVFTPTKDRIGLALAAGVNHEFPLDIFIADFVLEKF